MLKLYQILIIALVVAPVLNIRLCESANHKKLHQSTNHKKTPRKWLVALVVVLLVVGVIGGIALIGNFTTSAGNTDYSSYYNSFSGQGWTITSPFIKGTDSQGNTAYLGTMRNDTGNYSVTSVIHVFDTESAAQNDYTTQVTSSISQGYTTVDLVHSRLNPHLSLFSRGGGQK